MKSVTDILRSPSERRKGDFLLPEFIQCGINVQSKIIESHRTNSREGEPLMIKPVINLHDKDHLPDIWSDFHFPFIQPLTSLPESGGSVVGPLGDVLFFCGHKLD